MKNKIIDIATELSKGKITTEEAKDELLYLFSVVGRSEQLVCDCGKSYHERDLEHGMCHQCWEPIKETN